MTSATGEVLTAPTVLEMFRGWQTAVDRGDMESLRKLYAPDAMLFTPLSADPIRGRDAIWKYESEMHAAFPDARLLTRKPVIEHDTVAVEWEYSGRNTGPITTPMRIIPPTNRPMKIFGVSFLHFERGLISQERRYYDARSLYQQLGLT